MIKFDRNCSACSLKCGAAVGWSPSTSNSLKNIKLIVLSDYPGYYEIQTGIPLTSNVEYKKKKFKSTDWFNAGALTRKLLSELFELDVDKEVYITNVVKCDPKNKTVTFEHLKSCVSTWLRYELEILDIKCPSVPMLVAGSKAYEAIKFVYKEFTEPLQNLRRKVHRTINGRPIVFTYNPAIAAKGMPRLATEMTVVSGVVTVAAVKVWMPPLVGSPLWSLLQDLEPLQTLLNNV